MERLYYEYALTLKTKLWFVLDVTDIEEFFSLLTDTEVTAIKQLFVFNTCFESENENNEYEISIIDRKSFSLDLLDREGYLLQQQIFPISKLNEFVEQVYPPKTSEVIDYIKRAYN